MQKRIGELFFSGISLMLSLSLFVYTFFSSVQMAGGGVEHSPMFFPRIILGLMVVFSFGMLVEAAVKTGGYQTQLNWKVLIGAIIFVGLFVSFFKIFGFLITSFIFFIGYGYLLGYRRKILLILIASLVTITIWYIFNSLLMISLPGLPWE